VDGSQGCFGREVNCQDCGAYRERGGEDVTRCGLNGQSQAQGSGKG
jgi:hypothetical protein